MAELEEVTQEQYDHSIRYYAIKYGVSEADAERVISTREVVTQAAEDKWLMVPELLKLGRIIHRLDERTY